ncbi:hypothetical protein [Anaeromicropila populeti]|uniref:Sporulation integral membrane protein YlbJ n=1 Tax=Anaeromicropila populeti TaxID=37658 RepID=A0A1I6KI82_9FIRM|nr:hypothetical protein [Anaeromicropila populeti]SFR90937.1 sporulation integral membrane protein YlbJ [Anaeromicropila populeti]
MIKKHSVTLLTILLFLLLVLNPGTSLIGAKNGLLLWFNTIFPTLLPFMIIANLMLKFQVTNCLTKLFYPILGKILGVSRQGCYPIIVGMLSGYPVGAKICAEMVKNNEISLQEGQFLLCFCNNVSPMFVISFIAIECLNCEKSAYLILGVLLGSTLAGALFFRFFHNLFCKKSNQHIPCPILSTPLSCNQTMQGGIFKTIDSAIQEAFEVLVKIGGYIILFSILAQLLISMTILPFAMRLLFTGFLEITNGIALISISSLSFTKKIVLINFITGFGGLSSIAQTNSVISDSGLSIKQYSAAKLFCGFLSGTLTFLLINIF